MANNAGTLECSGITLAPDGGTFVVVLTATTATDSTNCGLIENTAMLTAGGKGEASASTNVECKPALFTIVKECPSGDQLDGARVGDSIVYKVTVTNDGNVDLTDVVVTDSRVGGAFYSDSAGTVPRTSRPRSRPVRPRRATTNPPSPRRMPTRGT